MGSLDRLKREAEAIHQEEKRLREAPSESGRIDDELLWLMSRGARGRLSGRPRPDRFRLTE